MRRYERDELRRFLEAVDKSLARSVHVVIIGGTAAALRYGVRRTTHDIDTWTTVQDSLLDAVEEAQTATGLVVPFQQSGVADGPFDMESRLERVLPDLRKLEVFVPEKHDLVLMKTVRAYEHDLETIEAIHRMSPLDLDTLVERYEKEMGAIIGDPARLRGNFLAVIERLFPEQVGGIERRLRSARTPSDRSKRRKPRSPT
jgi:hypothetical protein